MIRKGPFGSEAPSSVLLWVTQSQYTLGLKEISGGNEYK